MRQVLAILAFLLLAMAPAQAKKLALVVGNDDYANVDKLQRAVNDARAVANTMGQAGFEVDLGVNLDRRAFNTRFDALLSRIEKDDTVFFYFAGHGIELNHANFLLSTDVPDGGGEHTLHEEGHQVATLLDRVREAGAHVSFFVLDACRNNPFTTRSRSVASRGLQVGPGPEGSFVLMSAAAGQVALDSLAPNDTNPNSVFTRELLPVLQTPGLSQVQIAKAVQKAVRQSAQSIGAEQKPSYYDEFVDDFVLVPGSVEMTASTPPPERTPPETDLSPRMRRDEASVAECDRLAASPSDKTRVSPGVPLDMIDAAAAIPACRSAVEAKPDNPRLTFQLGRALDNARNYGEAAVAYETAVGAGHVDAFVNLGSLYSRGNGVDQNFARARKLFHTAATAGDATAMNNLGFMYAKGNGVPQDFTQAQVFYLQAATAGSSAAMHNLAILYDQGNGVATNPKEAARWIEQALIKGNPGTLKRMKNNAPGWSQAFREALQKRLKQSGFYTGQSNGEFGPDMAEALDRIFGTQS